MSNKWKGCYLLIFNKVRIKIVRRFEKLNIAGYYFRIKFMLLK